MIEMNEPKKWIIKIYILLCKNIEIERKRF